MSYVSGAGDTVIATVAEDITAGLHRDDAIRLANVAPGFVIGKVGTVPVTQEELLANVPVGNVTSGKIFEPAGLLRRVAQCRASGQWIVFTNGCFDLLHMSNLALLEQAKRQGTA